MVLGIDNDVARLSMEKSIDENDVSISCTGDVGSGDIGGELMTDSVLMDSVFTEDSSRGVAGGDVNMVGEFTSPGVRGDAEDVAMEDWD